MDIAPVCEFGRLEADVGKWRHPYVSIFKLDDKDKLIWDVLDDDVYVANVDANANIFTCVKDETHGMDLVFSDSSPIYDADGNTYALVEDWNKIGDPDTLKDGGKLEVAPPPVNVDYM